MKLTDNEGPRRTRDSTHKPRLSPPPPPDGRAALTPGFQNSSPNTTRSAEEKVRPMLAAVMDSTATAGPGDDWNCWQRSSRSAEEVEPSIRTCCTRCGNREGGGWAGVRREPRCWGSELQQVPSELLTELLSGLSFQTEPCVDRTVGSRVY